MVVNRMKLNYTVHLVVTNLTNLAIFHKENDVTLYSNYFRIIKGNIWIRKNANPSLKVEFLNISKSTLVPTYITP
jgi:hypothetical protein